MLLAQVAPPLAAAALGLGRLGLFLQCLFGWPDGALLDATVHADLGLRCGRGSRERCAIGAAGDQQAIFDILPDFEVGATLGVLIKGAEGVVGVVTRRAQASVGVGEDACLRGL